MNNIENIYLDYGPIIQEFTEEKVRAGYENLYREMQQFLGDYELAKYLKVDEVALTHGMLDYFTDISRLKKLHGIKEVNDIKVYAYQSYWLLRRHPLQIIDNPDNDERIVFANEKFVFSRLAKFLMGNQLGSAIPEKKRKSILNYFDTLYYYLKFRNYDAQMLELFILSFQAGRLIGENQHD